jgi:hypothetical protein
MSDRKLIPLRDPGEIPPNMTKHEAREFWDTHEVTEEYLKRAGPVPDSVLPSASDGTRTIRLHVDADTLRRIKALARKKRMTPQALLMEALAEWLPAAEERQGLISRG